MNKVGIITIHNSPNYGACLQSYALYKYIVNQGLECELIDLKRPIHKGYVESPDFKPYYIHKLSIWEKAKGVARRILKPQSVSKESTNPKRIAKFDDFNKEIKLSTPYYSIDSLYDNPPLYDVYISGSDQLWNPEQPFPIEPYFLTFVQSSNAKKISYASSIGISSLESRQIEDFTRWLSSYDAISVREPDAAKILQSHLKQKIEIVADPTFLLDANEWNLLAHDPQERGYILCFMLGFQPNLLNEALRVSSDWGKKLVVIGQRGIPRDKRYTLIDDAGPKEFLGLIKCSDCVFTDSFHGTVFSVLLGVKNFFSYVAKGNRRASRLETLLSPLGLLDRIVRNDDFYKVDDLLKKNIDIEKQESIIRINSEISRNFLNNFIL